MSLPHVFFHHRNRKRYFQRYNQTEIEIDKNKTNLYDYDEVGTVHSFMTATSPRALALLLIACFA